MTLLISNENGLRGVIHGHLFEDASAGLPRRLFWNLSLPCHPITWQGESWDCFVQCDWLHWPLRVWTGLDGATLSTVGDPAMIECSVYLAAHHPVQIASLCLKRMGPAARFAVDITGAFDLQGFGDLDAKDILFAVRGEIDFEGIVVVPEHLTPSPLAPREVIQALEPHLDSAQLGPPKWDRFRYVLKPAAQAAPPLD